MSAAVLATLEAVATAAVDWRPRPPTMNLIDTLNWRYATKKMDPSRPVAQDVVDRIVEAARLAPTSSGLQPYRLFVVSNPELKQQMRPIAYDQAQVVDASHVLVFAAWDDYTPERINQIFDYTNEVRGFRNEGWEAYRQRLLASYPQRGAEANFQHAARQAYIGFSAAIIAAASEGVDATPMEGFDADRLDALLGLRDQGLRSVLLLPLGHRAAEGDWLVNLKKVRQPVERFATALR